MQVSSSAGAGFINPEFTPAAPALPVATEPASTLDGWQHASPAQPRPLSAEPQQMRTMPLRLDDQPQPGLQRLVDEPPNPLRQPAIAIKPHATIVDAPASRSDAPVPASSSRLLMSEFVTSSLSPGIAAQIAAGGGRGSAAGAMLGNAQWTEDGSVSQAFPPGKDGRPLEVGGQLTAAALAAAEVAASAPVAPAAPKADPTEIAALELLLADPANQELIQQFGGELKPLPTWTSVGKGIEARYGADLGGRLYQLQLAQRAVEGEFLQAMDQALKDGPPSPWSSASQKEGDAANERPGWTYGLSPGIADEHWHFDPGAFARQYVQGDTPAQRAFVSLHGTDPVQFIPASNSEAGDSNRWEVAGITLRLGLTPDAVVAKDGWAPSRLLRGEHHLDPDRITKLNNKEFVWFDPVHGFSTDSKNLRGSWIDRAFPQLMGVAFGVMGAAAAGKLVASAGAVAQSAAMGAAGSALNQFVSTGRVSFKQVLSSALAGGLTAGVARIPGLSEHLNGAQTAAGRLMQATGRATIQGAIQAVVGGDFKGGFINTLMASAAGEISAHIDAQISQMPGLSAAERSSLRLLGNATGSALRAVANPGDPLAGLAGDFLGQVMGDVVQQELNRAPAADPLGDFIAGNDERRARLAEIDRQIEWELQADEARAASLPDDDMFIDAGGPARGGVRNPQPVVMVRNGNWDSALNVASDPLGLLAEMQGLQADLGRLDRINAENHLNSMRERMREAGMTDVPTSNRQAWIAGGASVPDYASTLSDLQNRYEDFRRDLRLRESWGDDYRNIRIGRNQMTVLEFERTMLNAQQRAIDAAFDEGRELIARGKIPVERGYAQTLGVFIDDRVRDALRVTANAIGVSESQDSTRLAVNRRISNITDNLYGLPDLRLGANIYSDTTLASKDPNTRQVRIWDYINRGHYLILRPSGWGGPYALPRDQVMPYNPNRRR